MTRLTSTLMALMLVLVLWTGVSAHAAERVDVVPAAVELGHFDGDSDHVPADQHDGVAHHHAPCADQHAAAMSDVLRVDGNRAANSCLSPECFSAALSREPDADLRPPIA